MEHSVRIELINNGLLIYFVNNCIISGALFAKFSLAVAQGQWYGALSENQTH